MNVKTYTAMRTSPLGFLRDARELWKVRTRNLEAQAGRAAEQARKFDAEIATELGSGLAGKKVLIIGPGQTLREWWSYSSLGADVVGIDLDVVPVGFDLPAYVKLLRSNGPVRFAKTVGRKVLRIDHAYETALAKALGVEKLRPGKLIAADASKLPFSQGEFDVVFSFSVFEHLESPTLVMKEISRVLRPGGFAFISTHLYAAEGGCHDLRIFSGNRKEIPLWAHLRPQHQHTVQEGCYMNKLRTSDFERQFKETWGEGVRFQLEPHHAAFDAELRAALPELRKNGELESYTDEELLSVNLIARWKREARPS
jgi:SAM-dependent methyltransferase